MLQTDEFSLYWYNLNHTLEAGTKIYVMTRFSDGKILDVNKTVVLPALPKTPALLKKITNTDKLVQVTADKDCEVTLTIGEKTYKTKEYRYDDTKKKYIYSLKTDRDISGTTVTVTAANLSGTSKVYKSKIVKAAPDSPRVNEIKAGDKVITGKIEVLDSETKVYAQIGTKIYQGTVDKKGSFKITVAKSKAGTEIKVWGTNKAGRGPLTKVEVLKQIR
jgi:2',3'-cyclic-nucleotide 2'-phosphodiesterase/3'-nucleotidase